MYFQNMSDLLTMNGHGAYVWAAYSIAFIVIIGLIMTPIRQRRDFFRQQQRANQRQQHDAVQNDVAIP